MITYQELYDVWRGAYPKHKGFNGQKIQNDCNGFWALHKKNEARLLAKFNELKKIKGPGQISIVKAFSKCTTRGGPVPNSAEHPIIIDSEATITVVSVQQPPKADEKPESSGIQCFKQIEYAEKIKSISQKIKALDGLRFLGVGLNLENEFELKALLKEKKDVARKLSICKSWMMASKKSRKKKKMFYAKLKQKYPDSENDVFNVNRPGPGRPLLEDSQPGLLEAIIRLVSPTGAAENRRRSEMLRCCKTIKELHDQLLLEGYNLSQSGLYLRIMPRNASTIEGKRHHRALPIKLICPQNSMKSSHKDSHFAAASIKFLKQLGEAFGEHQVCVISQDDKARIPLGIAAASKQSPLLMSLKYKIALPDHDWAVASKHKMIVSVYAVQRFLQNRKISYSGETYIAIRSGKHDRSTAATHAVDFNRLMGLRIFNEAVQKKDGTVKPIFIMLVDGGPDENPRFPKTLLQAYRHFKTYDLDAICYGCYAPGQSAYNPVERRMAPLSCDLSGIVLPHDHYGSHLDSNGKTVNLHLEKENFKKAGEVLASVWNENKIDNYEVKAEYIEPPLDGYYEPVISDDWISRHVRQSQYMLQIVKCKNTGCCTSLRSNLYDLLPHQFLPTPLLFFHDPKIGVSVAKPTENVPQANQFFGDLFHRLAYAKLEPRVIDMAQLPFDYFCPSVQSDIQGRMCPICGHYFTSKKAVMLHKKMHKGNINNEEEPNCATEADLDVEIVESDDLPVIFDIDHWRNSPFMETTLEDIQELQRDWGCDE